MKVYPFSDLHDARIVTEIKTLLLGHRLIAYPTDTLYGVGGRADSEAVCQAIAKLKTRPNERLFSVALGSLIMLQNIMQMTNERQMELLSTILPGPYTVVINLKPGLSYPANQGQPTLGVRIPALPLLQKLIESLGKPLITTSINFSGQPPLSDPCLIKDAFPTLDILLDDGLKPPQRPSTLIDLSQGLPYTILRQGAEFEDLTKTLDRLGLAWRLAHA